MDSDLPDSTPVNSTIATQRLWERFWHSPFAFQCITMGLLLFFMLGFQPPHNHGHGEYFGISEALIDIPYTLSDTGFLQNTISIRTAGLEEVEITDEQGNKKIIVKPRRREKILEYSVQSGDNITHIAHNFGLKVSTLLWANDLTSRSVLSAGDVLRIPPVDGVFFTVRERDTLSEIAVSHNITTKEILRANGLTKDSTLKKDMELFLPQAQRVYVKVKDPIITSTNTTAYQNQAYVSNAPKYIDGSNASISSSNITLLRPTQGTLTQGYHRNHYALDIANKWNTPIYAAADGIVRVSQNGWNGGYGNYIIIDHGDGIETLYGHNNIRKVSVGETVKAGQLIALMGNTGRVFGRTGIHLHFELRINGRKVNPANYY